MSTKSILAQLQTFLVVNNVRRNVGTFSANVVNDNQDVRTVNTAVLANGGTYSHTPAVGNKITVISTSVPLEVDVSFAGGGGFTKTVQSLLVLDMELASIEFTNSDTVDANLVIING